MSDAYSSKDTFFCPLCERRLKRSLLSRAKLKNAARLDQRICRQCETFLEEGLGFLVEKLKQKNLTYMPARESDFPFPFSSEVITPESYQVPNNAVIRSSFKNKPRAASAIEKEAFFYHSLSVERQIEGFIRGLEAAGIDRDKLSGSGEAAVNNLLQIAQTLAGQRRHAQSDKVSRADIRRMGRHIDDTSLMVNEYIAAVGEESLEP